MANFLRRHCPHDAKLAQRALLGVEHVLSSGRLIAFNGSLTTNPVSDGTWATTIDAYGRRTAMMRAEKDSAEARDAISKELAAIRKVGAVTGVANGVVDRTEIHALLIEASVKTIEQLRRTLPDAVIMPEHFI